MIHTGTGTRYSTRSAKQKNVLTEKEHSSLFFRVVLQRTIQQRRKTR
jgi:hypothetical protein